MLCHVALVRTDVTEELSASFIRVTRIGELGTTLAVTSNYLVFLRSVHRLLVTPSIVPSSPILVTLMKEALSSSETSVLTRATWRNIPEDTILQGSLSLFKRIWTLTTAGLFSALNYQVSLMSSPCDLPVHMLVGSDSDLWMHEKEHEKQEQFSHVTVVGWWRSEWDYRPTCE
jgi:hypothetical protein